MVEILLRQRAVASDSASATDALRSVFGVGTASVSPERGLRYEQVALVDDGISATRIASSGADVQVQAAAVPDLVVLAVRAGELHLTQDEHRLVLGPGDIGVVAIGVAAEAAWRDVTMDAFSFPRASLGRLLGDAARSGSVRMARRKATPGPVTALWLRTAALLAGEVLQQPELFESDVIREQAIDALLGVSIEAFGIAGDEDDDLDVTQALMARTSAHMRAHLGDPISVPDVAAAVGVSIRSLQLAFRRAGLPTPLMHLRALRMTAAREAFEQADASRPTTVGAVAQRLGYTNLGRFSAHYREAFGEYPAETLRTPRPTQ